jgi:spore germination cell wall hydrolase CwlJ-like protein
MIYDIGPQDPVQKDTVPVTQPKAVVLAPTVVDFTQYELAARAREAELAVAVVPPNPAVVPPRFVRVEPEFTAPLIRANTVSDIPKINILDVDVTTKYRSAASDIERQLRCLAQNIYYEAGFESLEGKMAVAQVTMNRAHSGKFPADVCQVVYQKAKMADGSEACQFSWYCESPAARRPISVQAYEECYRAAQMVLVNGRRVAGLDKAIYYHADYVRPRWNKQKVAVIGRHIFYSDEKA